MKKLPASRVTGLDLLRSIAVASVVLYHYPLRANYLWLRVITHEGWAGVDLFFVLSGYLIAGQYFSQLARARRMPMGTFYLRRLFRTWPSYFLVLALSVALPAYFGEVADPWRYVFFTQNFGVPNGFSISWSLCVEEHFYLVFPIIAAWVLGRRSAALSVATFLAVFVSGLALRTLLWLHYRPDLLLATDVNQAFTVYLGKIYYPTYARLDGLLCGIGVAAIRWFMPDQWTRLARRGNMLSVAAVATLAATGGLLHYRMSFAACVLGFPLLALGFGLLVLAATQEHTWIGRIRIPGVQTLALLSYAIYLIHSPAMEIAQRVAGLCPPSWRECATALLSPMAILGGASILYWAVEKPFQALRDRVAPLKR